MVFDILFFKAIPLEAFYFGMSAIRKTKRIIHITKFCEISASAIKLTYVRSSTPAVTTILTLSSMVNSA